MRIKLSRKEIADAILHNNETTTTGGDRMGVFVWPDGHTQVRAVGRGTTHIGPGIYDPEGFVETDLDDDTTQYWQDAREERIREGRVRAVDFAELTSEEHALINEYADLYESVWREELRYRKEVRFEYDDGSTDVVEIEWTD